MSLTLEPAQADRELDRRQPDSASAQAPAQEASLHPLSAAVSGMGADGSNAGNSRLVSSALVQRRANGEMRALVMRRVQQNAGNHRTQQLFAQLRRGSVVQRECSCGTCAACQEKGGEEDESSVVQRQAASAAGEGGMVDADIIPSASAGEPLDRQTRDFMEPRFGRDFSDVRVHNGTSAAESADALGADAYTTGRDIYFAAGKYAPGSREGQHLLAHELTHTVQQEEAEVPAGTAAQSHSVMVGSPQSPLETEAERTADEAVSSPAKPVFISPDRQAPVRRGWTDYAKGAWNATGGRVVNYVGEKVENLVEGTKEWFIDKVEKYAPGLITLLKGGVVDYLKEKITSGLDSIFGGLISRIQKQGFLGAIGGAVGELVSGLTKAASGLVAGACETFAHVAEVVTNFAKSIGGPIIDGIKKAAATVGEFFSNLWHDIGAPVWQAIKSIARTAWDWIEDKAKWIWNKTAPIRETISRVWNWIKKQFGLAWEGQAGVLDWLMEKGKKAWDKIYEFTKPIHGPLKVIGEVMLLLSPMGPIILIWKGAPLLWDGLTWLYEQWKKTDFIVIARTTLTEHILPAIASGAQAAASLLESAASWISEKVDSINTALGGLLDALGVSTLLSLALKAVQFVADQFRKFAAWVKNDFVKTLHKLKEILLKIWEFIKPILAFLVKLAIVVANPLLLPIVLTGYLWQALPGCFKPPIIDFVLDLLIGLVRAIPTFKLFGESWPPAKAKILGALTQVRTSPVDKKIEASNRVARIMSGDDLEWLGNLLSAMVQVPDHIEGQFEEELIGMDLTAPLPFERGAPPEAADTFSQKAEAGTLSKEDAVLLSNPHLAEGQIGVDHVANMELDPDLVKDLQNQGGEKEFRGPEDSARTIAGVQAEMSGDGPPPGKTAAPEGADTSESTAAPAPKSTDEELEAYMNQPAPDTCTKEKPAKAEPSVIPENLKIGPLTRGQRARYLLHQIGQGIKTWFKCNASWLVPAIIGVIAVLVGLEILTGGAITAALPEIMDILAAIMIGVAAVRAAAYTAEYVTKAISGDVAGAAKSLARGLAIVAIELIFALLFNLDKVIDTLKKGLKATAEAAAKAVKTGIKGTLESVEKLGQIGVKGLKTAGRNIAGFGRAIVKNGKLLFEGVAEGFAKGIRKVEELFQRLWRKLRFKAFRIRLSGSWFRLEGEINPWVLIAEGKVQWLEEGPQTASAGRAIVGTEVKVGGKTGLVVGKDEVPSALVKLLEHPPAGVGPGFSEEVRDLFYDALRRARAAGETPNLRQLLQQASIDALKGRSGSVVENILDGFRRAGIKEGQLDELLHSLMNETRAVLPPEQMLNKLNQLARMNPDGLNELVRDLAQGGNKFVGAEWVVRFVTESPGARVSAIRAFEEAAASGGRVYDVVMNGVHYELKNWAKFSDILGKGFLKEVLHDFKSGLLPNGMKWVFAPRIGTQEAVLAGMRTALRDATLRSAVNMTRAESAAIDALLERFVSVGL